MVPTSLRKICDLIAIGTMLSAVVIVTAVALSRNLFGYTPIWTEPVVGLLVFLSVCAALPAGLHEGVHVSMHFFDHIGKRALHWRDIVGTLLRMALGGAVAWASASYASDMSEIGLTDYAGIPQSLPAYVGVLFGTILALLALGNFWRLLRRLPG